MKPKSKSRKKPTGKKRGGQKGNQNARQHGLWAKPENHPATVVKSTSGPERRRDVMDDIIETLYTKFVSLQDLDQLCKCANAISNAVEAANSCDRTIAIIQGKSNILDIALDRLFAEND